MPGKLKLIRVMASPVYIRLDPIGVLHRLISTADITKMVKVALIVIPREICELLFCKPKLDNRASKQGADKINNKGGVLASFLHGILHTILEM